VDFHYITRFFRREVVNLKVAQHSPTVVKSSAFHVAETKRLRGYCEVEGM
jgi:hypothetical protein